MPIKLGIVGGGMISQIGHLPFYLTDPRCEVVKLAESRPSLVAALQAQLGPDRLLPDHTALYADDSIAAVIISAPRPATGPLTEAALRAGKHVMTEKPMAHTVGQAERLVEAARSSGTIYAVGFMKRYDPGVQAAKAAVTQLLADGSLGRLLLARFYNFSKDYAVAPPAHVRPRESREQRLPTWPSAPDWLPASHHANYAWFLNSASHDVNLMHFFFPTGLTVASAHIGSEGTVAATMTWQATPIVLEVSKSAAGRWLEGAEFLFERGRLALSIPSPMATEAVSQVTIDDPDRNRIGEPIPTGTGWSFARQATGFLDAVAGGPAPLTTGKDGLADLALIEEIWRHTAD